MILKMENYRYPSKDEWLTVSNKFPTITRFGFPYVKEMTLLLTRKETIKGVYIKNNLYEWDAYLSKKIWNLRQSYVNMVVNFNRGLAIGEEDFGDEFKVIQLFNFEFYAETSFYYLIAARDTIYQIINLAFDLDIKEHRVNGDEILLKLDANGHSEIHNYVNRAYTDLKEANDIRNSLAHKFSKLSSDRRGVISDDGRSYGASAGHFIEYPRQVEILDRSLEHLRDFFFSIRDSMMQIHQLEPDN
ncbi:Cthe_2314 family HEPN domain-containing protein [Parapedobacter soli]|uniref:Cthe_2314 family HEPN domain-containing protein n=1 Tax=Parapedobacter soli TaxID=416955 RepID=UPI0021CA453D|nr:Cthe_2314 family HEPN domain-containing protein [Parapedobacter soli]